MEKIDVSGKALLPVRGAGVHLNRQAVNLLRAAVDPDIVFPHQENAAFCTDIFLARHDACKRCIQEETGIIRRFAVLVPFLPENDDRVRVLPADIRRQDIGFHPIIGEIIPVLFALEAQQEKGHDLTGKKRNRRAEQGHRNASG